MYEYFMTFSETHIHILMSKYLLSYVIYELYNLCKRCKFQDNLVIILTERFGGGGDGGNISYFPVSQLVFKTWTTC